ncbi:uncharacterized protein LOC142379160 [Odontesthes bonariensis]|uniref:uncharacterized protein LOC142379160 n=1 Tax=Odontesthes bonariensis TaxID=219752 RepID=UPI003F58284F
MTPKSNLNFTSALLVFLLTFGKFWKRCDAQENTEGAPRPQERHGDGSAFFALRSCHQLLHSDSGEFFSPDYLCSNPPLWCNWTIQVDPEKRIHLHLEDLTPDKTCQFKQDQIHVDEPVGHLGGQKVLQKCWQEAKYTSSSNTLYVVQLIGGWPSPSYRGFYGRYQAFGPPVVYNPQEGFTGRSKVPEPSPGLTDLGDFGSVFNDYLFEVAVEVNFSQDLEESWDNLARLLLLSVKALISKQLDALHKRLSLSSKRIKRLNAGALYILWLQIGQGPGGVQIHRAVHSAMQGLLATGVNLRVNGMNAVIMSVSTADVNECGTQLVLCDINADCVNHFGSYSCHCRPGFQDESRLGAGGTICVDAKAAGCSSGLSSETKGVYVLFFLLSSLILTLLAVAVTLYHRHHRGAFLVRCQSSRSISPPDPNSNHLHPEDSYSSPTDSDLPPPPPPARGTRDGWAPVKERCPPVDLPLLRFSSLLPPDGYRSVKIGSQRQHHRLLSPRLRKSGLPPDHRLLLPKAGTLAACLFGHRSHAAGFLVPRLTGFEPLPPTLGLLGRLGSAP